MHLSHESSQTRGEGHIVLLTLFIWLVRPVCLCPVFVSSQTLDALIDKVKGSHTRSHMMSPRQTQELNTVYSVASLCSIFACLVDSERQRGSIIFCKDDVLQSRLKLCSCLHVII